MTSTLYTIQASGMMLYLAESGTQSSQRHMKDISFINHSFYSIQIFTHQILQRKIPNISPTFTRFHPHDRWTPLFHFFMNWIYFFNLLTNVKSQVQSQCSPSTAIGGEHSTGEVTALVVSYIGLYTHTHTTLSHSLKGKSSENHQLSCSRSLKRVVCRKRNQKILYDRTMNR